MNLLPPFRLYGLIGCPHCAEAETFLREKVVPTLVIIANDDIIAIEGIKAVTKKPEAAFPVLCCTFNNEIIEGFKKDEYDRLVKAYHTLFSPSPSNLPAGEQQPQPQGPIVVQGEGTITGTSELSGMHRVLDSPGTGEAKPN